MTNRHFKNTQQCKKITTFAFHNRDDQAKSFVFKMISSMTLTTILLLLAFATGAAFVQRTTGFGFGIFIMTMLPNLLPTYGEATALSGMLAMVTSFIICLKMWRFIPWRKLLPMLIVFLAVSFCAVQVVSGMDNAVLKRILGVMLIVAAVYFMFFSKKITIRPNLPTQLSLGSLSGVMGGFFGMQGPPAVIYFLSVTSNKDSYTAMAQTYFLVGNLMMTLYRANAGFVTSAVGVSWCVGVPAVLLGTWIGGKVYDRLSLPLLRKIVYLYIALSGVLALL